MPRPEHGTANGRHVLKVAPTPFFADRGCHVRILEEARALIKRGYRITVCTYHLGDDVPEVQIRRTMRVPWYKKLAAGPSLHKFYLDPMLAWTTLRACRRDRPDIIHAHLHEGVLIGWIASLLFRIPLVADLQGSLTGELVQHGFFRRGRLPYRIFRVVERAILRMPSAFLLSSRHAIEDFDLEPEDLRVPARIVNDGVDAETFYPANPGEDLRRKLSLPEDRKIVGYLGLLNEYQGLSTLLRAAQRVLDEMRDVHFLVMGYPNVEEYRRMAVELDIADRISMPGRIPYGLARDYLAACDVGVSAKQAITEANGKLLNYMAVGIPVVATDTEMNRELLGDLGVYADVDDPVGLAESLMRVLKDDDLARDLGRRLRKRAMEDVSWQAGSERIVEVYRMVGRGAR